MLKRILILLMMIISLPSFATDVTGGETCDTNVLNTDTGPVNLRAEFEPETINLKWYNGDTRVNVATASNTCTYDTAISLPANPVKPGYKFKGWNIIPGTRVEYIESTGRQWIDTGATIGVIGVSVDTNVLITDWSGEGAFVGVKEECRVFELFANSTRITLWNASSNPDKQTTAYDINQNAIHNVKAGLTSSSINLTVDGTDYNANIAPVSGDYTFTLFHLCDENTYNAKAKMYYFKLYKDGVLVRNMIPIKDYNGVACMYDLVTKQIFYNSGTGDFIAGPEI